MSRHRNVRSMNYEDEYYDDDDVYGHSVEENYCISPGTAAQFTYNRDSHVELSNYMGEVERIPEEDEDDENDGLSLGDSHRNSFEYKRPPLSDLDNAKLNSCLEEVRNVLGDTVPEHILIDTIMKHGYSVDLTLNELLNQQDAPKPQREKRENRRNRSQGKKAEAVPTTGPTVILKTPKPRNPVAESTESFAQVSVSDKIGRQSVTEESKPPAGDENQTKNIVLTQTALSPKSGPSDVSTERISNARTSVVESSNKVIVSNGDSNQKNIPPAQESGDNAEITPKDQLSTQKKERFIPPLPRSASKSKTQKFDLLEEYKKRQSGKDMINLVVIGHVDAGKSTLMGHLLYQLGNVNQRAMHKYEQESRKLGKSSFAYAWVLDETEEERVRGVTMDIAQTKFETPHKSITLLDAPGHKDFIPNMITGTAQADVAILVVNATNGEFETGFESGGQTREHALLARSLGVSQVIVAVNKMDTVGWQQSRYDEIVRKLGQFLKQAGFKDADTSFIPVSGLAGENLAKPVQNPQLSEWYEGATLVEQIDKFKPVNRAIDKPLRITVSDVFKGMGGGFTMTGKIVSGCVQNGDRVLVMPVAEYAAVKGITMNDEAVNFAFAGDHVSLVITGIDITKVGIGSVLCESMSPVTCATRIKARVVLFSLEIPMTRGFTVIFHYQSVTEPAIVKRLVSQLNKSTGEVIKHKPKCLTKNSSAVIEIEFEHPVCVELYKENKDLGRFMLRYSGHTIAAGLIEEVLKTKTDSESQGATGS